MNAKKEDLIVICSDVIPDALEIVQKLKEVKANLLYEFSTKDIPNK